MKTTTITITAARKRLAEAAKRLAERASVRHPGHLGRKVYALEGGIQTAKERAVRNARELVEVMEARNLRSVQKLVISGNDEDGGGHSTVFLFGLEVLLVQHSSINRVGLGTDREAALKEFIRSKIARES